MYLRVLQILTILFCSLMSDAQWYSDSISAQTIAVQQQATDSVTPIQQLLKPYRDSLVVEMDKVIGVAKGVFKKEKPSGSLGNLVVDAMFEKAKELHPETFAAICNYGGIRLPQLAKGDISIGKIYELLPFENELVILQMPAELYIEWLEDIEKKGGWPIANNSPHAVVNGRLLKSVQLPNKNTTDNIINATSFSPQEMLLVATSDYIANGGDQCHYLKEIKQIHTGILLRDVLIDYIKQEKEIVPNNSVRIIK